MEPSKKRGLDAIEERRRLREEETKSQAEQERKQLADIQKKTEMMKETIDKGTVIQTESAVDNSSQRSSPMTTRKE